jgi:malonyl-CoA reductase/3-hydroxypropionate dehydrogenase (NADP+)
MALAANEVSKLRASNSLPKALSRLVATVTESGGVGNSSHYLMHEGIANKLVDRLVNGGIFTVDERTTFMEQFVDAPQPFFDKAESR